MPRTQRNSAGRRKPVLVLLGAIGAALIVSILCGRHGLRRYIELRNNLDRREQQAYQRIARNRAMLERVRELRTDPKALEEAARTTLGVVDENEIVIVFRDAQGSPRH